MVVDDEEELDEGVVVDDDTLVVVVAVVVGDQYKSLPSHYHHETKTKPRKQKTSCLIPISPLSCYTTNQTAPSVRLPSSSEALCEQAFRCLSWNR
jgi:hypothetical protein